MQTQPSSHSPLAEPSLLRSLADNWWLVLLRGIASIVFGVLAFMWPGLTLVVLVLMYGAFALVDGVLAIAGAIMGRGAGSRWWLALVGVAGVLAGLFTFFWPGITAFVLLIFIAAWAIAIGAFQIVGAIRLRKEIDNEWLLILSGVVSVLFGFLLLAQPAAGALALVWIIAGFSIAFGIILVMFSFRLKSHRPAA